MKDWKIYGMILAGAVVLLFLVWLLKRKYERNYFQNELQTILKKREYSFYMLLKK